MIKKHSQSRILLARRAWQKSTTGMSLIEVLVTLAVVSLIMVSASNSVLALYKTNNTGTRALTQISSARSALTALMTDLRSVAYGNGGSYPIVSMSASSLTFFSNIPNSTGATRFQYQINGTTLSRSQVSAGTPPTYSGVPVSESLVTYIRSGAGSAALFRYYDRNGIEVTDMNRVTDVASILVSIDVLAPGMSTPFI
ncbi:MAG: type II secretion system protein, partial [Candidatus Pacebacteria bacterium]|nr:type II secretion system protein [Candidatus Paceibacterota bacterium]